MKFDPHRHLHIGYYEDNVDLEVVAYKLLNKGKWIVFLDTEQDISLVRDLLNSDDLYESYGYRIFTIDTKELTYDVGTKHFKNWLKDNNVI